MVKKKLFCLFTVFYLTLFFSSAHYGIHVKAAGNPPPQSPPYAPPSTYPLQSNNPAPQCRKDSCTGACTMETLVWGSLATFNTYMDVITPLTGCDKGEIASAFDVAFDAASELASIDTGAFLSCWDVWAGVQSTCANACDNNACRYAPDLHVSITNKDDLVSDQAISISLNNSVATSGLDTTAITGGIDLIASIQYQGWDEAIPYAWYELPSLGYPELGWSTTAAAGCTDDSDRCDFLNTLAATQLNQDISIPIPPQEGVYNLENLVSSSAGVDSDLNSGVAKLLNGDDRVTMNTGLSGITYVQEDDNWDGHWDHQYVETWNSWSGEYTVSNAECRYLCWFGTQKVNRDKFVIVLDGPCDSLLLGDYTLRAQAPLNHDQNITNNSDEGSYSINSIPSGCGGALDSAPVEATLTQGDHALAFNKEFIKYYRVVVPDNASLLEVILEGPNSNNPNDNLDLLLRRGSAPETNRQGFVAYDYVAQDLVGYPDKLRIQIPEPGEWFIEVYHSGLLYTNDFQLNINIETSDTPIVDLTEGQYALSLESGQTSQVFRLPYFSQLDAMKISYEPPRIVYLPNSSYKIYMCPQVIPAINYEHSVYPGFVCNVGGQVAFAGQGFWGWPLEAQVTSAGGRTYYILIERTSGASSSHYNLNIDFTWPATIGLEEEPNDSCATANPWPADELTIPKRGYFYRPGNPGDQDAYTVLLPGTGGSTEMETYLASVPANIAPDLTVYKKVGTTYQEVVSDRSAAQGGSPLVRFDLVYGQEYCILVESRNLTQNQTDPYSLYIRYAGLASTDETEVEPNDEASEASPWVNMDNSMRGRWSPLYDRDYFKWQAPSDGVYFLAVNRSPTIPTHFLIVFEQTGEYDDHTPVLGELNQGHNWSELDPVGLTFYATAGVNYYFELLPDAAVESGWYKLTLQHLSDYGDTCSGAAMLNLGSVNPYSGSLSNTITSQLTPGDKDCFHIKPAIVGSSYTLVLPQSPDSISPLVELFRYNPNAFDFSDETRTRLGQFTFTSGDGTNGEYNIGFTLDPLIPGLTYQFPGFTPNVGYCACISDGVPDGDNGQQDGSGQNGSGGDTDTIVTCCDQAPLIELNRNNQERIEIPGNQDYFKVSLEAGLQHRVSLHADCDMPLRLEVIENGVVVASGDTSNSPTCRVYIDFIPNGSTICLRVSALDSAASSDKTYNLQIYLNAR